MSRGFFKINIITFSGKDRNNNEVISRLEIVQGGQMIIFWLASKHYRGSEGNDCRYNGGSLKHE